MEGIHAFISPVVWDRPGDKSQPVSFDTADQPVWIRIRFKLHDRDLPILELDTVKGKQKIYDWRSVQWPPCGPFWATGEGADMEGGFVILVAYAKTEEEFYQSWPKATEVDIHERNVPIRYSDRFWKPDWIR